MADLLFIVMTVAFFALAAGFVRVCDRIIGPDGPELDGSLEDSAPQESAPQEIERQEIAP